MNEQPNTTDQSQNQDESTYSLLIRSEEKKRNAFELVMYPCLILGPLIAIWQFAQHPVNIPAAGLKGPREIVFDASAQNNVCRDGFLHAASTWTSRDQRMTEPLWQDLNDNCHCCHQRARRSCPS